MDDLNKYAKENSIDLDTLVKQAAKNMPSTLQKRKVIPEGLVERLVENDLDLRQLVETEDT